MNAQQLDAYLERIGYTGSRELTGATLDALIKTHVSAVPFENLDPYEFGITPSLEEDDIYKKIVENRRGGYCFEQNTALHMLLRDMGFDAYPVVVRIIMGPGPVHPYAHKGVVARAEGKMWYCDVGFGGPGPKGVVEMSEREQEISGGIYRCAFPEDYCEIQRKDGEEWPVLFRFPMHPIEPCDFIPLNYYIGGQPGFGFRSWRTVNLTLPNGSKALTNDHLTIRIDGEVTERDLQSRAEVEQVLREEFGLDVKLPE
ncbi:MAG: arylamine N-acetyltransferase [Oscillospiraceae bacterium]|nr:arylamine N-acetyltransferase [Oscillospiraceae bacterium]